jgi:hypothetical protein
MGRWQQVCAGAWGFLLACLVAGCASGPPPMLALPMDAYPFRQDQAGVRLGVDPLFSKEAALTAFPRGGDTFADQGLLPVRVMIENGSTEEIRVEWGNFGMITPDGQRDVALNPQDAFGKVKPTVGYWALVPILGQAGSAAREIGWEKQFLSRVLQEGPVPAGKPVSGFVFFYFPESEQNLAGTRLTLAIKSPSGVERTFSIPLQGRRDIQSRTVAPLPVSKPVPSGQPSDGPVQTPGAGGGVIIKSPAQ